MAKNQYISRKEAAKILGVNEQTISNYITRGFFRCKKVDRMVYVNREDFETKCPEVKEIADIEGAINEYKTEVEKLAGEYKKKLVTLKRSLRTEAAISANTWKTNMHKIMKMFQELNNNWSINRGLEMLDMFWDVNSNTPIAKVANLSENSVDCIINKAIKSMGEQLIELAKIRQENYTLHDKTKKQREHIYGLTAKVNDLSKKLDLKIKMEMGEVDSGRAEILDTKIEEVNLSKRCINCLKNPNGIHTVGDIVTWARRDLLKFRNMGKKSVVEIDDLLEAIGLCYEMSEMEIQDYLRHRGEFV